MLIMPALLLLAQDRTYEGELRERLKAPAKAIFDTSKQAYDLEVCVADALTVVGIPTVLRDGPNNIVIAAAFPSGNAFLAAVSISKVAEGSHLELRIRGKGYDDRIATRIKGCL